MPIDMAIYAMRAARPAIRSVESSAERSDFGPRYPLKGGAQGDHDAAQAPGRAAALGDARAALDLARLARRYESAALSASRREQSDTRPLLPPKRQRG